MNPERWLDHRDHAGWAYLVTGGAGYRMAADDDCWWVLCAPDGTPPQNAAGLVACCTCGWASPIVTPLTVDPYGAADVATSEEAARVQYRRHVRETVGAARRDVLAAQLRELVTAIEAADELGALGRLGLVTELAQAVRRLRGPLVTDARRDGASWAEVGAVLGVSGQAAQQRYPDPLPEGLPRVGEHWAGRDGRHVIVKRARPGERVRWVTADGKHAGITLLEEWSGQFVPVPGAA